MFDFVIIIRYNINAYITCITYFFPHPYKKLCMSCPPARYKLLLKSKAISQWLFLIMEKKISIYNIIIQ